MTLDWRHIRGGNMQTFDGSYAVTESTVWMHSLVCQTRWDATHHPGLFLGSYNTPREAMDACEQHAENQQ